MDYLITGLPRTRTAWLANLMTYGPSFCSHELITVAGLDGAVGHLSRLNYKFKGVSDSGAGWCWKRILMKFPDIKVLRITRPWKEAAESHYRYFSDNPIPGMDTPSLPMTEVICQHLDKELDAMANSLLGPLLSSPKKIRGYRTVNFTDLHNELTCAWIWEWLVPNEPFNRERWALLDKMRINLASEKY